MDTRLDQVLLRYFVEGIEIVWMAWKSRVQSVL